MSNDKLKLVFKDRLNNFYLAKDYFSKGRNEYYTVENITSKHPNSLELIKGSKIDDNFIVYDSRENYIKCRIYQYFKHHDISLDGIPDIRDSIR
jgi:hypothetical protein